MRRALLCTLAALVTGLLPGPGRAGESGPNITLATKEVSLGRLPIGEPLLWLHRYVSADKNHCAWMVKHGDEWKVVVDGREGRAYEGLVSPAPLRAQDVGRALIPGLVLSPDSQRLAYGAARGGHEFVVVDGREGPPYDVVAGLVFSPDSRRVAYEASHGSDVMVVVDGTEGTPYDAIGERHPYDRPSIQFSPDSRRVAYVAQRGGRWIVIVAGEESEEYDYIRPRTLAFSPDSEHLTYEVRRGKEQIAVLDGEEMRNAGGVVFSPDGRRVAYWARRGDRSVLIVDGEERGAYDGGGPVVFSPDGERIAFTVTSDGRQRVVVDGIEGEGHDEVMGVTFSPDGRRVAYVAATGGARARRAPGVSSETTGRTAAAGGPPRKMWAVVDGVAGNAYREVRDLQFSPDGNRVAYVATTGGPSVGGMPSVAPDGTARRGDVAPRKARVVVDGVEGPEYDHVTGTVVFSPDGSRIAYTAIRGGLCVVVVDGNEWGEYRSAHGPVFSPDGRHLVYAATRVPRPPPGAAVTGPGRSGRRGRPASVAPGGGRSRSGRRGTVGSRGGPASTVSVGSSRPRLTSCVLVVDGVEVGGYQGLLTSPVPTPAGQGTVVFDAPDRFHTLVERNGEAIRVEVEIGEG